MHGFSSCCLRCSHEWGTDTSLILYLIRAAPILAVSGRRGTIMRLLSFLLATIGICLVGCTLPNNPTLVSIAVNPASASASQGGTVQFTASGTTSQGSIVSPLTANWSFSGFTTIPIPANASIDANGLATCSGFHGTVPVFAVHPVDLSTLPPAEITPGSGVGFVVGGSQLTCK